jgi:hypothetical protein
MRVGLLGLSLIIGGCSIAPNTQDVTHLPTHQIAHRVRCETRVAIRDNLTQWLEGTNEPDKLALAEIVKTGTPEQIKVALYNDSSAKYIMETFADTAIAYDFAFNATENNKVDPTIDFIGIFHRGTTPLSIAGGYDRSRQNIETFLVTDTFKDLLLTRPKQPCMKDDIIYENNFSYPLTGNVGIGRLINEFANLTLFEHLSGQKNPKTRTYSATLTFTTTLSFSALPKLILNPIGMGFHLLDASLGLTDSRTDTHTLNIGFALAIPGAGPAPPIPPPVVLLPAPPRVVPGTDVRSLLFVNATGTPAEILAAQAVDQQILRFEVGRTSNTIVVPSP